MTNSLKTKVMVHGYAQNEFPLLRRFMSFTVVIAIALNPWADVVSGENNVPVVVQVMTRDGSYTGQLLKESHDSVEILDLKLGASRSISRSEIVGIKRDLKEHQIVTLAGLPNYAAWRIQVATAASRVQAIVAAVEGDDVYLNVGKEDGIERGVLLDLLRLGSDIKDPASGKVIGKKETEIGKIKVVSVQDHTARATFVAPPHIQPAVGDSAQSPDRKRGIAILPVVNSDNWETVYSRRLAEELTTGLVKRGIRVVERRLLGRIFNELSLQTSKLIDPETAVRIGKLTGAHAVLIGTISSKARHREAHLRVVAVETGEILVAIKYRLRSDEDMRPVARLIEPEQSPRVFTLRVRVRIDGRDELRVHNTKATWAHLQYKLPKTVSLNDVSWDLAKSERLPKGRGFVLRNAGANGFLPANAMVNKTHFSVVRGRGRIAAKLYDDHIFISVDDHQPGAGDYEFLLRIPLSPP